MNLTRSFRILLKLRDNGQAAYLEEPAWKQRINYWGFGDGETYYMAPKAAYAKDPQHADRELKLLIRQLHKNGIEIILQMYFSPRYTQGYIREVLRYWVSCYHVDGFHLFGTDIPMRLLGTDPYLKHTKLIHENPEADAVYKGIRPLTGDDIAEVVYYAASAPAHVQIAEVLVMPTFQANGTVCHRKA